MHNAAIRIWILATGIAVFAGLAPRMIWAGQAPSPTASRIHSQAAPQTKVLPPPATQGTLSANEEIDYVPPYIALALKAGTLGLGVELTVGLIEEALNIRVGGNYLPVRFSGEIKDVDYEVEVNLGSIPMLLDWHPLYNNFRITGGLMYNRNRAHLDANLNDSQKIGDHEYTPEEIGTLTGSVDFNKFVPYVGLGFGNAIGGPDTSWNFVFDVGIMFQGTPNIGLSADGTISADPTFQEDLAQEEDGIQDEADWFRFYPVISAGISYQF